MSCVLLLGIMLGLLACSVHSLAWVSERVNNPQDSLGV